MKSVFLSKKMLLACALICVAGLTAWGEEEDDEPGGLYAGANLSPNYPSIYEFQASPKSVVNASSGELFTGAIDDYIGVTTWQDVEVGKGYVFLGGTASPNHPVRRVQRVVDGEPVLDENENPVYDYIPGMNINGEWSGALMGGYATNLGGNRLAFFYNGSLVSAYGSNNGAAKNDDVVKQSAAQWNNNLAVLFGSEAIGGIRFDFILNPSSTKTINGSKVSSDTGSGETITTLQWGKALGDLKPSVMLGFRWPEYTKSNDGDTEKSEHAALGLKAAADYKALSAYYQMTADFGTSTKTPTVKSTTSGYFDNRLGVSYTMEVLVGEKLALKARPGLSLGLNLQSNKTTSDGDFYAEQPETRFQIAPIFDVGGKYAVNEKWNLYTGVQIKFLTFDVVGTSTYKPTKDASEVKDTPSAWKLTGLSGGLLGLGFELHPSDNLSVEFGLNNYLGESYSSWYLNLGSLSGSLAVNVKF
jgi:hypothetical protein